MSIASTGRRTASPTPAAPSAAPTPEVATAAEATDVPGRVLAVISKVSAYPLSALGPSMSLVDDLGFDSLMVGDMATGLADAFPGLGGIPQELLINRPSVQDIIDFVATGGSGPLDIDDDADLRAWQPSWLARELPDLPERSLPDDLSALVLGTDLAQTEALAVALGGHGIQARSCAVTEGTASDRVDLVIYMSPPGPSVSAVINGEQPRPTLTEVFAA